MNRERFLKLSDAEKTTFSNAAIAGLIGWAEGIDPRSKFRSLARDARHGLKLRGLFKAMAELDEESLGKFCDALVDANEEALTC